MHKGDIAVPSETMDETIPPSRGKKAQGAAGRARARRTRSFEIFGHSCTLIESPNSITRSERPSYAGHATGVAPLGTPAPAKATRSEDMRSASSRSYVLQSRVGRAALSA